MRRAEPRAREPLGITAQLPDRFRLLGTVEGNGRLDVIYRSLSGQVYVQNFGATTTNLVSWATHRGNMQRDGNCRSSLFPPGTPLVTRKASGFNRASFSWTTGSPAQLFRIYRAEQGGGPFVHIATVTPETQSYTDNGLKSGWQYFYEVRAVYATNTVASSPFCVLSLVNSNLLANAGFEENDNSHWDKWFSGSIEMTNMTASSNVAHQGKKSMRILLQNQGNNSSIAQFDQYGIPDSTVYVQPGNFYSYGGYFKSGGISQPSEHWLTWISSKTGYDTNNRPALPWPYYFTPRFVAGTNETDWTYVNRTFQLPAGFPNIELGHSYTIAAPGSGSIYLDDVFFRPIPAPTATNWSNVVPFGSSWRYFTNTPPSNWDSPDFNDASWPVGIAKFGAGSGPTNVVTRLPQLRPAYYFRKQFFLASGDIEEFLLSATCTDDSGSALYPIRLFLNGAEVKCSIETVTSQGNEVRYFDLAPFAGLIHSGINTVAIMLSNYWSGWDDVAFDISLRTIPSHSVLPKLAVRVVPLLGPQIVTETPAGTMWQLQSSEDASMWQFMQTVTSTATTLQTILDTGQAGRLPPGSANRRFYRIIPF